MSSFVSVASGQSRDHARDISGHAVQQMSPCLPTRRPTEVVLTRASPGNEAAPGRQPVTGRGEHRHPRRSEHRPGSARGLRDRFASALPPSCRAGIARTNG